MCACGNMHQKENAIPGAQTVLNDDDKWNMYDCTSNRDPSDAFGKINFGNQKVPVNLFF